MRIASVVVVALVGGVACGGGGGGGGARRSPVVIDDPGPLRRQPSAPRGEGSSGDGPPLASGSPAGPPVELTATLTTIGPITGTTQVPDELERLLPGDTLTGKLVVTGGRGEPAFEVTRAGAPLLTAFYDDRQRVSAVWIHAPSVATVWGVPVGSTYPELAARVAGLECSALGLDEPGRAACSSSGLDNVVFVLEPVAVWRPSRGPADERAALGTDEVGEPGDQDARALSIDARALAGAHVTRIMWWPAD